MLNSIKKMILFRYAAGAGSKRIILDRNSFFHGDEVVTYVKGSGKVCIYGTALGFLVQNKKLLVEIENIAKTKKENSISCCK
ncbi:MAG: hypothetical protein ACTFAL_00845 [Candidatus Electronema sp. V4]|uniref:hypothetical protein n=1 Tax=Candidatus Electronema sp. V4 TaxID=3454756 RepID=UPI004055598F